MVDLNALGDAIKLNWPGLESSVASLLMTELAPVIKLEAADLRTFGVQIAKDFVAALRDGDTEWLDELKGQLKLLAEIARIRVEVVEWDLVEKIVRVAFRAAVAALGAAVPLPK